MAEHTTPAANRIAPRMARGLAGVLLALLAPADARDATEASEPPSPSPAATTTPSVTRVARRNRDTDAPAATPRAGHTGRDCDRDARGHCRAHCDRDARGHCRAHCDRDASRPLSRPLRPRTPSPTPTPTPVPTPPAVTVTGPLLVFSERVGVEEETDDGEIEVVLHEVVAYDARRGSVLDSLRVPARAPPCAAALFEKASRRCSRQARASSSGARARSAA